MKLISLYPEQFYSYVIYDLLTSSCTNQSNVITMIRALKWALVNNLFNRIGYIYVVASLSYSAAVSFKFKDLLYLNVSVVLFCLTEGSDPGTV